MRPPCLALPLSLFLLACSAPPPGPGTPRPPGLGTPPTPTPVDTGALPHSAYEPAHDGFVVHKWGAFTSVLGSDGQLLLGLHHKEEDLPGFVADRLAQATRPWSWTRCGRRWRPRSPTSTRPRPAWSARVDFPKGLLTQWYPFAQAMTPPVFTVGGKRVDRYTQSVDSIPERCQATFHQPLRGGMLDWGDLEVLPPQAPEAAVALPSPLGATTWGFARRTAANPLRVRTGAGEQFEKFLFYRGLGDFALPLGLSFAEDAPLPSNRDGAQPLRGLLLMVMTRERAGFRALGNLAPGASLRAPLPEADQDHPAFVRALKARLAGLLVEDGLYTDEALAMVDTWERSYFLTPGVRLLYLLPRAHTDRLLPLTVEPASARLERTMVMRTEIVTPAKEATLHAWLAQLSGSAAGDGQARFLAPGRFAEPLLSRAMALAGDERERAAGEALLGEGRARRRGAPLAAE